MSKLEDIIVAGLHRAQKNMPCIIATVWPKIKLTFPYIAITALMSFFIYFSLGGVRNSGVLPQLPGLALYFIALVGVLTQRKGFSWLKTGFLFLLTVILAFPEVIVTMYLGMKLDDIFAARRWAYLSAVANIIPLALNYLAFLPCYFIWKTKPSLLYMFFVALPMPVMIFVFFLHCYFE